MPLYNTKLSQPKIDYCADSCARIIPPNVTVSFDNLTDTNGRYKAGTIATISCDDGYELYGLDTVPCGTNLPGIWNHPVEQFRCIPSDQSQCFKQF